MIFRTNNSSNSDPDFGKLVKVVLERGQIKQAPNCAERLLWLILSL